MVPGITDPECRVAEFRYRELHAEAERQRRAASAASVPAGRVRVTEMIQCQIGVVMAQVRHLLVGLRTHEAADPTEAHGTVAVN